MSINRRAFLKGAAAGGAAVAASGSVGSEAQAISRPARERPKDAVGLLYDSTLCIGCKACVKGCKDANGMPVEIDPGQSEWNPGTWDTPTYLSGKTLNVIQVYMHGSVEKKDQDEDGFAFIKRQCLHCVDPSCVSCCPVSAMNKDPVTGIVSHDKDKCIGCRYCVFACPFGVPKFDLTQAFGQIQKCQLCKHRLAENQLPGCVDSCPTGATLFGRVDDLDAEARRRIQLKPGDTYAYPRGDISGKVGRPIPAHEKVIEAAYRPDVYGDTILGGTQALYVSAVSFDKLGLPYGEDAFGRPIKDRGFATQTEGLQHTLYRWLLMPAVVLAGLATLAYRTARRHGDEGENA
jgi:Fe-S-cluster-containing dehydrogenase component